MTIEQKQEVMNQINDILVKNSCTLAPILHINPMANIESKIQVSFDIIEIKKQEEVQEVSEKDLEKMGITEPKIITKK